MKSQRERVEHYTRFHLSSGGGHDFSFLGYTFKRGRGEHQARTPRQVPKSNPCQRHGGKRIGGSPFFLLSSGEMGAENGLESASGGIEAGRGAGGPGWPAILLKRFPRSQRQKSRRGPWLLTPLPLSVKGFGPGASFSKRWTQL